MDEVIRKAVARVIETMHENLGEQITVDDMARTAMFSKFHFSRIFQRVTGISPGRFLSAWRLQKAKQLLTTTSLSVTDISHQVGYSSVGTFSTRFTNAVGVSPSTYRRLGGVTSRIATDDRHASSAPAATVCGHIQGIADQRPGLVFVGLFSDPIPQGRPVSCTVLSRPGPYRLEKVPQGAWHLLAHSVAADAEELASRPFVGDDRLTVGSHGPIKIRPDTVVSRADLQLRPMRAFDPPVLLALLDVRSEALRMVNAASN
jgi:AraC family transcriptional regulator